jgi:glycosyltransferase involved in cell wall biosynthesis
MRYETRIFSGVVSPFAAPSLNEPGRNIFYCHTPPRFLYDLRAAYDAEGSAVRRLASHILKPVFQRGYEAAVARMHTIIANSQNVRKRIADHLGRDSVVVYPPCDTEAFTWQGQQGYYLSTARLSPLKRVDKIIEAFLRMPDQKLVVASQGDEFDRLKALGGDAQNITFLGWVSEVDLHRLIGEAIATIYIPVDEDFGMSPVESMAAGKPCIGVAEGGLLETVLDGETGVLLKPGFAVDEIVEAVHRLTPQRALSMRHACQTRAGPFDRRMFVERMREIISVSR